jgi:hypothetical protein
VFERGAGTGSGGFAEDRMHLPGREEAGLVNTSTVLASRNGSLVRASHASLTLVDIRGREVVDALMVAAVIIVFDKCSDLTFEVARQIVVLKQDAVLQGLDLDL